MSNPFYDGIEHSAPAFPLIEKDTPLDTAAAVQFISAAIAHGEAGLHEEVIVQLTVYPDRLFSRSIAQILSGSTEAGVYSDFAENTETETFEMDETSKRALDFYFGVEPSNAAEDVILDPKDIQEVLKRVMTDVEASRIDVLDSDDSNRTAAIARYEESLKTGIGDLFDIGEHYAARELSEGAVSTQGKARLSQQYWRLVEKHIAGTPNIANLLDARQMINKRPGSYTGLSVGKVYDKQVIALTKTAKTIDEMEAILPVVDGYATEDMRFELKQAFDRQLELLIEEASLSGSNGLVKSLTSMIKLSSTHKRVQDIIDNQAA